MRSQRELMREMLENAVIESAKPNYKFYYPYGDKEVYKVISIQNGFFYCMRELDDPHNHCEKTCRYHLQEIDKVLDFIFLEEELKEKDSKLIDLLGKEQIEKEANLKMLDKLFKYVESEFEEASKTWAETRETNGDSNIYLLHHTYTGKRSAYENVMEYIENIKKKL
jgi:hypothetical protein